MYTKCFQFDIKNLQVKAYHKLNLKITHFKVNKKEIRNENGVETKMQISLKILISPT